MCLHTAVDILHCLTDIRLWCLIEHCFLRVRMVLGAQEVQVVLESLGLVAQQCQVVLLVLEDLRSQEVLADLGNHQGARFVLVVLYFLAVLEVQGYH